MHPLRLFFISVLSTSVLGAVPQHRLLYAPSFNIPMRIVTLADALASEGSYYPPTQELSRDFTNPSDIAFHDGNLFICVDRGIFQLDPVSSTSVKVSNLFAFTFAIVDNTIIYSEGREIRRQNFDGSEDVLFANVAGWVSELVFDGEHLFWADEEEGIYTCDADGSNMKRLFTTNGGPMAITYHGDELVWFEDGLESIFRGSKAGGEAELLVDLEREFGDDNYFVSALSVAGNRLWMSVLADQEGIYSADLDSSDIRIEFDGPRGGGWVVPNTESGEQGLPFAITGIYTGDGEMLVTWNAQTGKTYRVLTSNDLSVAPVTSAVVNDELSVQIELTGDLSDRAFVWIATDTD